ncbi:MAG: hypothetical protein KA524_03145 [Nitrosomonas sp.]|nr:hypothetical protein [Nitrosomonas sp.]MBP6076179.1 hypothetical protein [Nitrosomonas sp.]
MIKISLAAAYHISIYLLRIVTLLLICSVSALAKNNCETNASQINPANFAHSGIGGTGSPIAQSGIGGTGIHDGGTGSVASDGGVGGTGIIGIITGFASICANGIEIHYDVDTPVSIDGRLSTVRDLAVGQVIAVRSLGATTSHELTASHIAVIHAAVGPISHLNPETRELYVLGQTVQVGQLKDHGNFSNLKTGDWVQVSGHRLSSGVIVASRIESTTPQLTEAGINGYVTQIDAKGFEVNGTRIDHDVQLLPGITQGMEVRIAGHWDGAHLKAQHIQIEPTRQSIGNVEHLVIEGYIHALDDKGLNINNQAIAFESAQIPAGNTRSDFRLDQRIQISGRLGTDQRVIAERIELKHESPVQLQERNDRSQTDGRGNKKNLENEPEIKPAKGNESSQTQRDGHSDGKQERNDRSQIDGSGRGTKNNHLDNERETKPAKGNESSQGQRDGNKDSLKKEIDHTSGSRSENPSSFKDEKKLDDSGASWREDTEKLQNSREQKLQGHHEQKLQDSREQNSSDYQTINQPEKLERPDAQDRPDNHRDHLQNNDVTDRVIDHRDNLRDIDISDRVRDHGVHHDRHFDR